MTTFPSLIDYSKHLQPFSIGFDKFFDDVSTAPVPLRPRLLP